MDVLAALKCWPLTVELGGREYTIPPISAQEWFLAILGEKPLPIVPGLFTEEEQEEVDDLLVAGEVTLREIVVASREALEAASGWRWWEADRLIRSAGQEWKIIGGKLAQLGVDLSAIPLGAALNVLYSLATSGLDEQKRIALDMQIAAPPAELEEEEREALGEQMFLELLGERQTG